LKLSAARLDVLIWTLIYGGLLAAGLGIALARNGEHYGVGIAIASALVVAIGAVLVWVRSRLPET
jgi:hypothetical protein